MLSLPPSTMVTRLRSRLGDLPVADTANARIIDWLNAAQYYIASKRSDWNFCLSLNNSITTASGTHTYTVGNPIGSVVFNGSGLDDATSGGTFTQNYPIHYQIEIDGTGTPDTFKWSKDAGSTYEVSTVSITGSAQTLDNGVTVTFTATTGHTSADIWDFFAISDFRYMETMRNETDGILLREKDLDWLYKQDETPTTTGTIDFYTTPRPTGTNNVHQTRFWYVPDSSDTITYDYYRWLPPLETTVDLRCLIPDHELVMMLAEVRGRIDNEEPEDSETIQLLHSKEDGIKSRYATLALENVFAPNKKTGSRPSRQLIMRGPIK